MTTDKRPRDAEAYRDLPYLLKPSPVPLAQGRRASGVAPNGSAGEETAPPPPSAGFNPYFDLPPDSERPPGIAPKGTGR